MPDSATPGASRLDPAVIDGLRRLGNRSGRDVLGELTSLFVRTARVQLASLEQSVTASRHADAARRAHGLKGSSSVIGGRAAAEAAAAVEEAALRAERGAEVDLGDAMTHLSDELRLLREAIGLLPAEPLAAEPRAEPLSADNSERPRVRKA